ncbi:MAG: DNA polymerase III subunit gamma/tau [Syntrophomonadaceae bacterium]|nr:DNA polymerase III subunit gamma/tau [Syntrophomonadaceae bacterium]
MSYVALYREWRPQNFQNVVGQTHVTRTLLNALQQGRISHAYLFCGPRGTGKTSVAKILAKAVNCSEAQEGEPCNQCVSCRAIVEGSSLDVLEIDAASNRGIDEIRELRERVQYAPSGGRFRVYIIDEVHMLTTEAFNALLKTLEEPPSHVIFVLATTEAHKVPATILSRCQRFDFRRITPAELIERLKLVAEHQQIEISEEAIMAIVRAAEGGLRDALSLLDQCIGFATNAITLEEVNQVLGTVSEEFLRQAIDGLAFNESARLMYLV